MVTINHGYCQENGENNMSLLKGKKKAQWYKLETKKITIMAKKKKLQSSFLLKPGGTVYRADDTRKHKLVFFFFHHLVKEHKHTHIDRCKWEMKGGWHYVICYNEMLHISRSAVTVCLV